MLANPMLTKETNADGLLVKPGNCIVYEQPQAANGQTIVMPTPPGLCSGLPEDPAGSIWKGFKDSWCRSGFNAGMKCLAEGERQRANNDRQNAVSNALAGNREAVVNDVADAYVMDHDAQDIESGLGNHYSLAPDRREPAKDSCLYHFAKYSGNLFGAAGCVFGTFAGIVIGCSKAGDKFPSNS